MSEQWEGGKGDKNRVADHKAFCDNYDLIFKKDILPYATEILNIDPNLKNIEILKEKEKENDN